jgi:hypothetical protein
MAPNLAASQHVTIHDMIIAGALSAGQMGEAAGCIKRYIKAIRSNMRYFVAAKAPPNGVGRRQSVTPSMLEALRQRLLERPGLYIYEMVEYIWKEFRQPRWGNEVYFRREPGTLHNKRDQGTSLSLHKCTAKLGLQPKGVKPISNFTVGKLARHLTSKPPCLLHRDLQSPHNPLPAIATATATATATAISSPSSCSPCSVVSSTLEPPQP